MTERHVFMAKLAEQRVEGLVALRLDFHPARAMSPEEIFAALNEVEASIPTAFVHDAWSGDKPAIRRGEA